MARTIVEQWNSPDKKVNVKIYDDGSVRTSVFGSSKPYVVEQFWGTGKNTDFKGVMITPKVEPTRNDDYWVRQGRVLSGIKQSKITSEAAYRKLWEGAGHKRTPGLEREGYVKWINGQLTLTKKGADRLHWIIGHTWHDLAQ